MNNHQTEITEIKEELDTIGTNISKKTAYIDVALEECRNTQKSIEDTPFIPAETVEKINNLYGNIKAISNDYKSLLNERDIINNKLDALNLDFEKMNERLQDLFELAGLGLSVEMFTHEFDYSIRSIRQKNQEIIANVSNQTIDSLIQHVNYVSFSLDALRKQMSYFNPGLKYVRAEKQLFSFKEFIESHKHFYSERCKNNDILFDLNSDIDFDLRINRGMLSQVFDNLFSNAEYWLDYSKRKGLIERKQYNISIAERGVIIVWDNGVGISPDIEKHLFEPFESKKTGGRGLGLYIAAENLKYSSSRIRLLNERNKFGNLYKFEIDVSQVVQ